MSRAPSPQLKAQLTGAFVIFHIIAISVTALPSVRSGLKRAAWKDPAVVIEMNSWAEQLTALGVEVTREEFADQLWDVAVGWQAVRDVLGAPFAPYVDLVGARQSWRLFTSSHRYPSRLEIDVERGRSPSTVRRWTRRWSTTTTPATPSSPSWRR